MAINAVDFLNALEEIEASKGISKETILQFLEESLIKAYKKQLGGDDANVRASIDPEKGTIELCQVKDVVKEVEDDFLQISVEDANALDSKKKYKAPIFHMANANEEDQAERISELIKTLKNDNIIKYYSDVAVLFRTNKSVERLIKPFEYRDIPYILKDNKDYLMQNEVRAVLTMFWYLMPYNRYELNHLGDDHIGI